MEGITPFLQRDQRVTSRHGVYIVDGFCGAGAFGQVYRVHIEDQTESFALKVGQKQPGTFMSYQKEVGVSNMIRNMLVRNDQEHLASLIDSFEDSSKWYLVYEFLKLSIFNLIENNFFGPNYLFMTQQLLRGAIQGLSSLHSIDIIHTDIRPENIMVSEQNVVKLIDFGGCVRSTDMIGTYIQSRYYRAPEVILELNDVSKPIDIWSLGCVAAEFYLGLPVFAGVDPLNMLQLIEIRMGPFPEEMIDLSPVAEQYFENYQVKQNGPIIDQCNFSAASLEMNIQMVSENEKPEDTANFIDLMKGMLSITPSERFTLPQIENHPFMTTRIAFPAS